MNCQFKGLEAAEPPLIAVTGGLEGGSEPPPRSGPRSVNRRSSSGPVHSPKPDRTEVYPNHYPKTVFSYIHSVSSNPSCSLNSNTYNIDKALTSSKPIIPIEKLA